MIKMDRQKRLDLLYKQIKGYIELEYEFHETAGFHGEKHGRYPDLL